MYSCKRAALLMSQSLDHQLSVRDRARLYGHFLICRSCRLANRQLQLLRVAARRFAEQADEQITADSEDGLPREAREAIRARLQSETDNPSM